jgi:hypothetical protein
MIEINNCRGKPRNKMPCREGPHQCRGDDVRCRGDDPRCRGQGVMPDTVPIPQGKTALYGSSEFKEWSWQLATGSWQSDLATVAETGNWQSAIGNRKSEILNLEPGTWNPERRTVFLPPRARIAFTCRDNNKVEPVRRNHSTATPRCVSHEDRRSGRSTPGGQYQNSNPDSYRDINRQSNAKGPYPLKLPLFTKVSMPNLRSLHHDFYRNVHACHILNTCHSECRKGSKPNPNSELLNMESGMKINDSFRHHNRHSLVVLPIAIGRVLSALVAKAHTINQKIKPINYGVYGVYGYQ